MPDIDLMGAVYPDVPAVTLPRSGGGNATYSYVDPDAKTAAMTQAVGVDGDGKLWTEPGGGGGSTRTLLWSITTEEVVSRIDSPEVKGYSHYMVVGEDAAHDASAASVLYKYPCRLYNESPLKDGSFNGSKLFWDSYPGTNACKIRYNVEWFNTGDDWHIIEEFVSTSGSSTSANLMSSPTYATPELTDPTHILYPKAMKFIWSRPDMPAGAHMEVWGWN